MYNVQSIVLQISTTLMDNMKSIKIKIIQIPKAVLLNNGLFHFILEYEICIQSVMLNALNYVKFIN
jgi:hypothetical protein